MQRQASLLNELELSFRQGDATRRKGIVIKIGQLFVASADAYSAEQVQLFGEVLTRLVEEIGIAARAKLSRTLCRAPGGPSNLLRKLALDDALEVAKPYCQSSPPLMMKFLSNVRGNGARSICSRSRIATLYRRL